MASNTVYEVIYEYGNKVLQKDLVIVSAATAFGHPSIASVLTSNSKSDPSGAIKIVSAKIVQTNVLS